MTPLLLALVAALVSDGTRQRSPWAEAVLAAMERRSGGRSMRDLWETDEQVLRGLVNLVEWWVQREADRRGIVARDGSFDGTELDQIGDQIGPAALRRLAQASGLVVLGCGAGRVVLAPPRGKFVIKVAYNAFGSESTQRELDVWHDLDAPRNELVPIVAHGPGAIVMLRVERVGTRKDEEGPYGPGTLRKAMLSPGLAVLGIGDVDAPRNWGRLDGRWLLLDYGFEEP